jgi:X-X-X-Leu-X-X-Gly heptad repeat protein
MEAIISVIIKLLEVYAVWIIRQKVINSGLLDYIKNIGKANKGTGEMAKGLNQASDGARKFGNTMKAIGWTALIMGVVELASAFWDVASGANEARFQTQAFEQAQKKAQEQAQEIANKKRGAIDEVIKQVERELILLRESGATEEELTKKTIEGQNRINDARKKARMELQTETSIIESKYKAELKMLQQLGVDIDDLPQALENAGGSFENFVKNSGEALKNTALDPRTFTPLGQLEQMADQKEMLKQQELLNKKFVEASTEIQKLDELRKIEKDIEFFKNDIIIADHRIIKEHPDYLREK